MGTSFLTGGHNSDVSCSCRLAPVAFLFAKKGLVSVTPTSDKTFDDLFELAIEGGAEDVRQVEGDIGAVWEVRPFVALILPIIKLICGPIPDSHTPKSASYHDDTPHILSS